MVANVAVSGGVPWVALRYRKEAAIRVWGPMTGRPYEFNGARADQQVDARDAAIMVRGGLFYTT
jgi:hypothetical protein